MTNKSILIWISNNIESEKEYDECINDIKSFNKFNITTTNNIGKGIDQIKQIKFEECIIIIDSDIFIEFNKQFNKIIDGLYLIPKIIVFDNKNQIKTEKPNECRAYITKNKDNLNFMNEKDIYENFESIKQQLVYNDTLKYFSNNDKFTFEQIKTEDDLSLLMNYHKLISEPSNEDIRKFNFFLYETFKNIDSNLSYLLNQTFKNKVPKKILIRYWLRIFSFVEFSKIINEDLKKKSTNFDIYVKLLYFGLKNKYITPILNQNFYRGGTLSINELDEIKKNLKNKNSELPGCICFSKVFLNFSLKKEIGMKSMEDYIQNLNRSKEILVFFEIIKGEDIDSENATNVEFDKVSFFPDRKEVLFFPYSCFEVSGIEEKKNNSNKYFHIKLIYLGKYKKSVQKKEPTEYKDITPGKFVKTLFFSKICPVEKVEEVINNNPKLSQIKKEILDNNFLKINATYSVNNKNKEKPQQVINYNENKNSEEIKESYVERVIGSEKEKFSLNNSFKNTFKQTGMYKIQFVFKKKLSVLSKLFDSCSNLINIDLSQFPMIFVTDTSNMFNGCEMLEKIDLSNVNSLVSITSNMFCKCKSLKYVNLSNFTKKKIEKCEQMFYDCESLKQINFTNIKITGDSDNYFNMFPFGVKFESIGVEKNSELQKAMEKALN